MGGMEGALERALKGEGVFAFPGVLWVRGPDAPSFLQGQTTRDVRRLKGPTGTLFLNHKGQIEEAATLFPHMEGFLLAPWGRLEDLKARLKRYIVFDQVELAELPLYRLVYADGREALGESGEGAWPSELYPPFALLKGLPLLEAIRGELPQAVGLEGLVDRGKGCYVGQEIMARTEGKAVHRRLVGLQALSPSAALGPLSFEGRAVGEAKLLLPTPFGLLGLGVVRQEVPFGAEVEGEEGRFRLLPWPFGGEAWSEQRS
jgi:folate-binding protein YgfZ